MNRIREKQFYEKEILFLQSFFDIFFIILHFLILWFQNHLLKTIKKSAHRVENERQDRFPLTISSTSGLNAPRLAWDPQIWLHLRRKGKRGWRKWGKGKKRGGWGTARKGAGERNRDKVEPSIVERPSRRMEARVVLRLLAGSGTRLSASEKSILFPISGS